MFAPVLIVSFPVKLMVAPVLVVNEMPDPLSVMLPSNVAVPPVLLATDTECPVLPVTLVLAKSRLPVPPLTWMPSPPAPGYATAEVPPTVASLTFEAAMPFPVGPETLTPSTSAFSARSIPSPPELVTIGADPPGTTRE